MRAESVSGTTEPMTGRHGTRLALGLAVSALLLVACQGIQSTSAPASTGTGSMESRGDGDALLQRVGAAVDAGRFVEAEQHVDAALADAALPHELRTALEFERERMHRIRLDFTLDRTAAIERARRVAPALSEAQFDIFDAQGLIEALEIDGQRHYFNRAPWNLFRLSAEARALRPDPDAVYDDGPYTRLHRHHEAVLRTTRADVTRFTLPQRVRITQSLSVDADAVPAGETIRAWIPYPREIADRKSVV